MVTVSLRPYHKGLTLEALEALAGKIVSPNGFLGKVVFRAMASKFNRERFHR